MDFLKACTTNVHAVENVAWTPYVRYSWNADRPRVGERLALNRATIAYLRAQNVLCTHAEEDVWIFGYMEDAVKHHLDTLHQALVVAESGTLEDSPANTPVSGNTTNGLFLDAIEYAVAYKLAQDANVLHVGPWTWLYCQTELDVADGKENTLISMSTKWSESGALYLVPRFHTTPWHPLEYAVAEDAHGLVLAPMGYLARPLLQDVDAATSNRAWKDQVVAALAAENIHLSAECDWQAVEVIDGPSESLFVWPTRLCLAPHVHEAFQPVPYTDQTNWRSWFAGTADQPTFVNPFALAEAWFNGASERQRVAQQSESSPAHMEDLDNALASAPADGQDANIMSSPFNQRQFDQQAAMAGIYPTPPDGLTQSLATVQTNLVTTPSVTNADQVASTDDSLPTSNEITKDADRPTADNDDFQLGPEDLFGDVGEIGFGENDVGDADFSFFDEPDDDTMAADDTSLVLPVSGQAETLADVDAMDVEEKTVVAASSPDAIIDDPEIATDTHRALAHKADSTFQALTDGEQKETLNSPPKIPYEKPLSPFGIRERLLPPPVPASMAQSDAKRQVEHRRNSTFQPVNFRAGFDLGTKYASVATRNGEQDSDAAVPKVPSIGLPAIRKKSRALRINRSASRTEVEGDSESEEDSFESSSSESDIELPPRLPWDNRKRKRANNVNATHSGGDQDANWFEDLPQDVFSDVHTNDTLLSILVTRSDGHDSSNLVNQMRTAPDVAHAQQQQLHLHGSQASAAGEEILPPIAESYELREDDLIYVAQVVSEHSATALGEVEHSDNGHAALHRYVETALSETLADSELRDLGQVALIKEPPPRVMPSSGKGPQGQPRPPQRTDSTMNGPDYFSLPPPYVKVQRGNDGFEMLPTSLPFWEPLGLGPTSGPKDVQAFCVFPGNADLQRAVRQFMTDVGTAYESCKFGSHVHSRAIDPKTELDSYQDGLAPVRLENDSSIVGALKAYAHTCAQLGKALASIGQYQSERAVVVYMLDPFADQHALHHLSACFWVLFKAYRENLSKAQKSHSGSDIVLQIVPIDLVASFDTVVVLSNKQSIAIAREVYDRCPPSSTLAAGGDSAVLPILSAPSVELASSAPKRIGFQLAAEPPHHLLHEGSILHLAYACSKDGQWVTAAWSDNTGLYHSLVSYSLRGKSLAEVAEEIFERTYEILAARKVTWRLFIVTHLGIDQSASLCWRALTKPRAQPLCVTLSSVQLDPVLAANSPASPNEGQLKDNGQDGGFPTPASTPQGNNFPSSPDVSGQSNAPPTPAPSETPASVPDLEMETHLVDTTDETWGALISPAFSSFISDAGLATALIFRRGGEESASAVTDGSRQRLPGLGVTLHWTIQVKPNGAIDEGTVKQAELTLREVVKMYRNLALLTKAKGLDRGQGACVPLPVAAAMLGAEGLDGLLPAIQ